MYYVDGDLPEYRGFFAWVKLMLTGGRYMSDADRIKNALRPLAEEFSTHTAVKNFGTVYTKVGIEICGIVCFFHLDVRDRYVNVTVNDDEKDIRDFIVNGREHFNLLVDKIKPKNESDTGKMIQVYIEMIRIAINQTEE